MTTYTVTIVRDGRRVDPAPEPYPKRIPRTYYAKRLLEHGPLPHREFVEITGWPADVASRVLNQLSNTGIARLDGREWALCE